jgi:hypothetical protein
VKIAIRALIAVAALLVLGVVALAVFLPPYVDSPEFREMVAVQSEQAIGRRLEFEDLSVGFLPPSIQVVKPSIAGATPDASAFFEANSISLRLAILPLLTGTVLVDSLVIDGARVEVVSSPEGLSIPTPPVGADAAEVELEAEAAAAAEEASDSPVAIAIRSLQLRNAQVVYIDRMVDPIVTIDFEDVDLTATGGSSPESPIAIELAAELASGGTITGTGSATIAGHADMKLELDGIALDFARPYAEGMTALDAELFGTIEVKGPAAAPERLAVALELRAEKIAQADLVISGPIRLGVELAGDLALPAGKLELDASDASIIMGPADAPFFVKPENVPTRIAGRFSTSPAGATLLNLSEITLASMRARAEVEAGDTVRLALNAPPFDIAGVRGLVPALEGMSASGSLEIADLVVDAEPISIAGAIVLHELRLRMPDAGELLVRGKVEGIGDGLRFVETTVDLGGQVISISGQVTDLAGLLPFEMRVKSVGVLRASPMLAAVSPIDGVLRGPLELDAKVAGRAGDTSSEDALILSLTGGLELQVGKGVGDGSEGGRLVGISLIDSFFDQYEQAMQTAQLAVALSGKEMPDLEHYTGDEFERMEAVFQIGQGRLNTRSMRIVYRGYGVKLRGSVGLIAQDLDMTGEIQLGDEIIEAMGSDPGGKAFIVPLAHVGGTVEKPEIEISPDAVESFTRQLLTNNKAINREVDKLMSKLNELFQ